MSIEVITFGCRLNAYESEVIKAKAAMNGVEDAVIINSCAVTSEAERQLRQTIRKVKKNNPDKKVIVTGCAAQVDPGKYIVMPEVHAVIGNTEKLQDKAYSAMSEGKSLVSNILQEKTLDYAMVERSESKVRAYLQVQTGCNHRCTFCIIPYGRGNSRSLPFQELFDQAKNLVANGCKELVITGVDITDYGLDLPGKPSLGQLVKRLLIHLPELPRIRLSSIDVAEIDKDLIDVIANEERFMPHLHLSLQAGDNMILKRMKRRHSREQVIEFCKKMLALRPGIAFGADIITGFPTETDDMFDNTYNLLLEVEKIVHLHIFPYSERNGTPAARMPQVPKQIRKERATRLRDIGSRLLHKHLQTQIGRKIKVLAENNKIGRAEDFCLVDIAAKQPGGGEIITCHAVSVANNKIIV